MYLIDTKKVEDYRKKKNMTRRQLGIRMGYGSCESVYKFLNHGVMRSSSRVLKLCEALGITFPEGILIHPKTLKSEVKNND